MNKFFKDLNFELYLTKPQVQHLKNITNSMFLDEYKGKMNDVSKLTSQKNKTSVARFLSKSKWNETAMFRALKSKVIELIWSRSKQTNKLIYVIIDHTISEKTKPSSKALNPIEMCSLHHPIKKERLFMDIK